MKRVLFLSAAALLGLIWAGCTPDELSDGKDGKLTTITLSLAGDTESADATTRTMYDYSYDYDEGRYNLSVYWADGDKIAIYGDADDTDPDVFTLSRGAYSETGTFTGRLTKTGTACTVVYPYVEGKKISELSEALLFGQQKGTLEDMGDYDLIMGSYNAETNVVSSFEHQIAVMKIFPPFINSVGASDISIRGAWGDFLYYAKWKEYETEADSAVYIAVPAVTVPAGTRLYVTAYKGGIASVYFADVPGGDIKGKMIKLNSLQVDPKEWTTPKYPYTYPVSGIHANHEYITIDGLHWATCNVGACVPWERGDGFAFGSFGENNAYYAGTDDIQGRTDLVLSDGTTIGGDVAAYRWGHGWRMPKANGPNSESVELDLMVEQDYYNDITICGYGTSETSYLVLPAYSSYNYLWSSSVCGSWAWKFQYSGVTEYIMMYQCSRAEIGSVRPLLDLPE